MKKKVLTLLLVFSMTAALITGCGGNSDAGEERKSEEGNTEEKTEEKDEEKELISWLDEAVKQYEEETLRGSIQESTASYDDGSTDITKSIKTIDDEKKIVMSKYEFTTNTQLDFYTQEDGKEYWYAEGYGDYDETTGESARIPLKMETENGYTSISEMPGFLFESTDWMEVVEQKVTNAREEDGMIKIRIDKKIKYKMSDGDTTRESVLSDYGWTEEELTYLDGLSEALDAYVKETNEENKIIEDTVYEIPVTVWITKDEHKLVKEEGENPVLRTGSHEAETAFYNMRWKLESIKSMMSEGISLEEAKAAVDEDESATAETASNPEWTGSAYVVTYVTGEDCVPLEEIPANAKEITEEQYYNGEY